MFLFEGVKVLLRQFYCFPRSRLLAQIFFRVALALVLQNKAALLECRNLPDLMMTLRNLPPATLLSRSLLPAMFHLKLTVCRVSWLALGLQ
jgi:hypothetical protein